MQSGSNLFILQPMGILFSVMLAGAVVLTPLVMRLAHRLKATDRGGYRRIHKGSIPLLGGLAVAGPFLSLGFLLCLGGFFVANFWEWTYQHFPRHFSDLYEIAQWRGDLLVLLVGSIGILALGMIDDIRGLGARTKLAGQTIIALLVCSFIDTPVGINIPLLGQLAFGELGGRLLAVFWFLALINAFNLIDGMDGLATGVGAISALTFAALGTMTNNPQVFVLGVAFAACLAGFLIFNFYPARVFLGDTGSMFIGFVFAFMTLTGSYRSEGATVLLAPLIAVSFPLFETVISIIRRHTQGLSVFAADSRHTHHRLLARGYSQRQTVLILYAVVAGLSGIALADRILQRSGSPLWWVPIALYFAVFIFVLWFADYIDPWVIGSIFRRRQRNRQLENLARYGALSLANQADLAHRQAFFDLCRHEMRLSYFAVWFEYGEILLASSGKPDISSSANGFDTIERFRISTLSHHAVVVRYQFEQPPSEAERQAVTSCLARLFESSRLAPPSAAVLEISPGASPETEASAEVDHTP